MDYILRGIPLAMVVLAWALGRYWKPMVGVLAWWVFGAILIAAAFTRDLYFIIGLSMIGVGVRDYRRMRDNSVLAHLDMSAVESGGLPGAISMSSRTLALMFAPGLATEYRVDARVETLDGSPLTPGAMDVPVRLHFAKDEGLAVRDSRSNAFAVRFAGRLVGMGRLDDA